MTPEEALSLIPGWDPASVQISRIKGGLTNRSFRINRGGHSYVLRLDAEHTKAFNLDRSSELAILRHAAAAGLAPDVVFSDTHAGIMLCVFLPGTTWDESHLNGNHNLEALAHLLRRVHALPLSDISFDPVRVARRYAANLESHHGLCAFATQCEEIIAQIPLTANYCCCHNDIIAKNVIATPALRLLDWEYACDNDPLFDLASLIGFHNLGHEQAWVFLSAYAGGLELWDQLQAQVRLYDAIQWLWLANRHLISDDAGQAARLEELQQRIG